MAEPVGDPPGCALVGLLIDTISRVSESCSPSGSLPSTSAPMPTQFSTHVDLHRHQC